MEDGGWFREIRKLNDSGHQTSILTTHPNLPLAHIAGKMFSRWTQENYFKYMSENYDFDRMIEYGTEKVNPKRMVVNPEYRKLTNELKKTREKKTRIEARVYRKIESKEGKTIEQVKADIANTCDLIEQVNNYNQEITILTDKRSTKPSRISLAEMPKEKRYDKLKQESKKYKNAIVMLAYRAETALYNVLSEFFKETENNGRMLLKEIFSADADMIPDYQNKTLTIALHSMSTPRANQAVAKLCVFLNETATIYPYTELKMIYKTIAL